MTDKFWAAPADANWEDANVWALSDGGSPTGVATPTSSDNVFFSSTNSHKCTVGATAACANLDFTYGTGFVGTFTGSFTLNIYGSLKFNGGMTNTLGASIAFKATSGVNTIKSNGVVFYNNVTFNGSGGTFQLLDDLSWFSGVSGGLLTLSAGTFDPNGNSVIAVNNISISGAFTFYNFSFLPTSPSISNAISLSNNITISNVFTINEGATVTKRCLVSSTTIGTPKTITCNGSLSLNNVDFQDITGAGSASWDLHAITGLAGDCGGNSGMTLTIGVDQHWTNTNGGTWSTAGNWTSRVPLPQDNVYINCAFGTSKTVTADMPRLGKSIDWTGATWTTGLTWGSGIGCTIYGSLVFINGLTFSSTFGSGNSFIFAGRGSYIFNNYGQTFPYGVSFNAPTGTLQLLNNFVCGSTSIANFVIANGTFDANNFGVKAGGILGLAASVGNTILMGNGTWEVNGIGNWDTVNASITKGSSTIKFTNTSNTAITFTGNSKTYNNIYFSRGASTGSITITGSNTFNDFKDDGTAAHSIIFTHGTTNTVTTFTVSGTVGNVITLNSDTTATYALTKSGGGIIQCDYLDIFHSVARPWSGATGTDTWYAGVNSTIESTATAGSGWLLATPPLTLSAYEAITVSDVLVYDPDKVYITEYVSLQRIDRATSVNDSVTVSENVNVGIVSNIFVFEPITTTEALVYDPDKVYVNEYISIILSSKTLSENETIAVTENVVMFLPVFKIIVNETVTVSENFSKNIGTNLSAIDTVTVTENAGMAYTLSLLSITSVTVSENIARALVVEISPVETITVSETTPNSVLTTILPVENITVSENIASTIPILFISANENITVSEFYFLILSVLNVFVEAVFLNENVSLFLPTLSIQGIETVTVSESVSLYNPLTISKVDSVTVSELATIPVNMTILVPDVITVTDNSPTVALVNMAVSVSDSITVSEDFVTDIFLPVFVSDSITVTEDVYVSIEFWIVDVSDSVVVLEATVVYNEEYSIDFEEITISEYIKFDIIIPLNSVDIINVLDVVYAETAKQGRFFPNIPRGGTYPSVVQGIIFKDNLGGNVSLDSRQGSTGQNQGFSTGGTTPGPH